MTLYHFTLIVEGADLQTDARLDSLWEAGCDDATFGVAAGVQHAAFDREADSYADAVVAAIRQIEQAVPEARVTRLETDELVTVADIARRTGRTHESVRLLVSGGRGPGNFPPPAARAEQRNQLWWWPDVMQWFTRELGLELPATAGQQAEIAAAINAKLALRGLRERLDEHDASVLEQL
ncbi:MAG: hypothetical protein KY462_16080 [Actinobacteria bacterium]|nr:hypothetical protein [Actinomycetota bacterium]